MNDPNTADWIIAIAGVMAAVATSIAAGAAWISARASAVRSREARDALAAAIEPELDIGEGGWIKGGASTFGSRIRGTSRQPR